MRVAVVQRWLHHYRRPLFNRLAELHDVNVIHTGAPSQRQDDKYTEIRIAGFRAGPLFVHSGLSNAIDSIAPDVVISEANVRLVSVLAQFAARKRRFVWWGMGAGSHGRILNKARLRLLASQGSPLVVYHERMIDEVVGQGVPREQVFVANNTVHVEHRPDTYASDGRYNFVFVGTFDERKRVDLLLQAFATALPRLRPSSRLVLLGDGATHKRASGLIDELSLRGRVDMLGRVEDDELLAKHYRSAIAAVSFGQAGLAVLQSLAHGVPFITTKGAVSGGEVYNITDGQTGFLTNSNVEDYAEALIRIATNQELASTMGRSAYSHYSGRCTIESMVEGFEAALHVAVNGFE